ncbi:MAG: AmmeMemoRadiSam system protein A [Desulfobaccales bacterium]|nr:AmmeMemoRadiSam system protein A [Desulfobaccales bacterium]
MNFLRLLALSLSLMVGSIMGLTAPPAWGGDKRMTLSDADQKLLFQVARENIKARLAGQSPPALKTTPRNLMKPRGVFVTLHRQGRLRGCIGYLEAVKPLLPAVQEMAVAAAFQDPRFPPLGEEELADLQIEISVLTPMRQIKKVEEIQVGKHGLYIVRGMHRGLLLPQVATEQKWDRPTFLEQTCAKAGLPPDAWKDAAAQIYVFSAQIFSEQPKASRGSR